MSIISSIARIDYLQNLPNNIPSTAIKSFLFGGAISWLQHSGNASLAFTGGVMTAAAALIDSAMKPFFHSLFGEADDIIPLIARKIVVVSLIASQAAAIGTALVGMQLAIYVARTVLINILIDVIFHRNLAETNANTYYYVKFHPWLV